LVFAPSFPQEKRRRETARLKRNVLMFSKKILSVRDGGTGMHTNIVISE
jgi:hypothetical protein